MVAGTAADTCIQPPSTLHRSTRMHHLTHTVRRISRRMSSRHTATRQASASGLAAAVTVVDITEAMAVTTVVIAETIIAAIMVVVTTAADTTVADIITVITKIWPSGIQPGSFLRPGFFIC